MADISLQIARRTSTILARIVSHRALSVVPKKRTGSTEFVGEHLRYEHPQESHGLTPTITSLGYSLVYMNSHIYEGVVLTMISLPIAPQAQGG